MKKLVLFALLLVPVLGTAQEKEWLTVTVRLWQEYRDTCYADSSVARYRWIYVTGNESDSVMQIDGNPRDKYQKRQPAEWRHRKPTFDGFMEFLARKKSLAF